MEDDVALEAILALEALWRRKRGRLTLRDLGIPTVLTVRRLGFAAMPPERWRDYPRSYGGNRQAAA